MPTFPSILPLGDSGLVVTFGDTISPTIHDQVMAFTESCSTESLRGVTDVVPTYVSVAIYFDPLVIEMTQLRERLSSMVRTESFRTTVSSRNIEIPVLYGQDCGPDLQELADATDLSPEEVISLHTSVSYRVYMLGFSPGFPYLGIVPQQIAATRLAEPRSNVPAGSVGIAGQQTGIYPQDSPGGWRIIGQTPLQLYDCSRTTPFLLKTGDRVSFRSITREEFEQLRG